MNLRNLFIFVFVIILFFLTGCQSAGDSSAELNNDESAGRDEILAASTATVAVIEEPLEPWQIEKQLEVEHKPTYVAFMNEQIGVTNMGLEDFYPSFTTDGGQTWIRHDEYHSNPGIVHIANEQSIWMCNSYALIVSKDGGETLESLTPAVGGECKSLSFLDNETGWFSTTQTLSATKDGANSWEEILLPESVYDIATISLRTPEAGYLLDTDGTIYSTKDGGKNWTSQTINIGEGNLEIMDLGQPSAAINFQDEENGIVILNLAGGGKSEVVAIHTADGGENWERHRLPIELGGVYLSLDGRYLTVTDMMNRGKVSLLKRSDS